MESRDPHLDECPSKDFTKGKPQGTCWGDGHYECPTCIHYRADFKRNGQEYIDWVHSLSRITITTLEQEKE